MLQIKSKVIDKNIDYTSNGIIVSNTKVIKTFDNSEKIETKKINSCFIIKNTGCSGLSKLFLK